MNADTSQRPATRAVPPELADVSLLDIGDVCATIRMSISWVHDEVRAGRFPKPLRFGARCSRWRQADVRAWLVQRAAQPQTDSTELVTSRAKKASEAAKAKRVAQQQSATAAQGSPTVAQ